MPQQVEDLDAVLWKTVAVGELQSQAFPQTHQGPPQPSKRGESPGPSRSQDLAHHRLASRSWAWGGGCLSLGWRIFMTWGEGCRG